MDNFIIIAIIVAILGLAISYIVHEKKNGAKCIGCPQSKNCGGCCGCKKTENIED